MIDRKFGGGIESMLSFFSSFSISLVSSSVGRWEEGGWAERGGGWEISEGAADARFTDFLWNIVCDLRLLESFELFRSNFSLCSISL